MMQRQICSLILGILCWACQETQPPLLKIQIQHQPEEQQPLLEIGEKIYRLRTDSLGYVVVPLQEIREVQTGELRCGKFRLPLYFEPGQEFSIYLDLFPQDPGAEFQGRGALKNELWNGKFFPSASNEVFALDDSLFISSLNEKIERYAGLLDSLQVNEAFAELIKRKCKYKTWGLLNEYPERYTVLTGQQSKLSAHFFCRLDTLIKEENVFEESEEYRQNLPLWIRLYTLRNDRQKTPWEELRRKLDYVHRNIRSSSIAEYLTDKWIFTYVDQYGIDSIKILEPLYRAKVTTPVLLQQFERLCRKWQRIQQGQPAPDFVYSLNDSVAIHLKELRGKYVYLGIWDSACPAAQKEMRHFRELIFLSKKKNIVFVGLSCDIDKETWEQYVIKENPGGIQLYMGEDRSLPEYYNIKALPHFILLDPQGNIVEADMLRPSDYRLAERLKKLL